MSSDVAESSARVLLRRAESSDAAEYTALMRSSRAHLRPWFYAAETPATFEALVRRAQLDDYEFLLPCLREEGDIVGSIHLSQIYRGGFQNAYVGFAAGAALAGRGLMREGLELALSYAFGTLRLHRVEANVQPANGRSRGLVERCGFRHEGFSPRYLKIGGRWRDHERYALTIEDWKGNPSQ